MEPATTRVTNGSASGTRRACAGSSSAPGVAGATTIGGVGLGATAAGGDERRRGEPERAPAGLNMIALPPAPHRQAGGAASGSSVS